MPPETPEDRKKKKVAEVGVEPTNYITGLSTRPLCRFAYSAKKVADSGVAPDHWAYETRSDTGPSAKKY